MQVSESNSSLKKVESKKFISMMNSLTWYIRQDVKNQQKIFECLNSREQKKLFESMRDQQEELRITAVVFILYLLYKNEKLLSLILKRDGLEMNPSSKKYIIGGLKSYELQKHELIDIMKKINCLEEQNDVLCWSINIKTKKVQYFNFEEIKGQKLPNIYLYNKEGIDPKENIIGIFTNFGGENMTGSKLSIKAPVGQGVSKGSYLDKHKTARH